MKRLFLSIAIGLGLTIICYSTGIFFIGADLLLLPVVIVLFLIGISGLITIPAGIYILVTQQIVARWHTRFIGLAIGFYLGIFFQAPIDN